MPDGPGALVLTNDQRIESNASVRIAGRTLEERIAELEVAVGETANDDEFEPDGSEDQALHRPDRIVYTRPPLDEEAAALRNTLRLSQIALLDTEADDGDDVADDDANALDAPVQFRHGASSEMSAKADAVFEEAPMAEDVKETLTAAEVHVFSSPDEEIERIAARLNGEPVPDPAPKQPDAVTMGVLVADEGVTEPFEAQSEASLQDASDDTLELGVEEAEAAFEADLEDAVGSANQSLDESPDMSDTYQDTLTATDVIPEANAPLESTIELGEQDSDTDVQGGEADATGTETVLAEEAITAAVLDVVDEDDLRPIVARMIRDELQGELGERITRNVRKLVRREILRALAARDVE